MEAVSGPKVRNPVRSLGDGRTHGGIKAREVRTEGERFVPFGEASRGASREALPSERLSLPLGQV